jgi:hypothetical protein
MKEIPAEIFFLFRMLGLIRGLCTTLRVAVPYMDIMATYARKALVLKVDQKVNNEEHRYIPHKDCSFTLPCTVRKRIADKRSPIAPHILSVPSK